MANGKLHGGRRTRGSADYRDPVDLEGIEKTRMCIRLRAGGCIGRQRCTQITEPRHRNNAKAAGDKRLGERETLIVTATGTVHDEYRRSPTHHDVFDRAAAGFGETAAASDPFACVADVLRVAVIDQRAKQYKEQNRKDENGCG